MILDHLLGGPLLATKRVAVLNPRRCLKGPHKFVGETRANSATFKFQVLCPFYHLKYWGFIPI